MLNAANARMLESPRVENAISARRIRGLLKFLFDETHYQAAENIARSQVNQLFVPVSPQGCAAMTEACLRYCPRSGGRDVSLPSETPVFAHVLLTFQQHLLPQGAFTGEIDFTNLTEVQFAVLACNYLGANYVHAVETRPARFYAMFENEPSQSEMRRRSGLSAREWFVQIVGIDPLFFRILALGTYGYSRTFDIDHPEGRSLLLNFDDQFKSVRPPIACIFRTILQQSVVNLDEVDCLPAVTTWDEALYRFNYLRRKPLWPMRKGQHLMLHPRFFVEKFFEGVPHILTETVATSVPRGWPTTVDRRIAKVRSDYGYIFDDYCRTVLRTLFAGPSTTFEFGFVVNGEERDGLVALPGWVLLFEFVQHPINMAERGTGEIARFLTHLHDNVQKLASVRDEILAGRKIAGCTYPTEQIVPIVITSDTFPVSHLNAEAFHRGLERAVGAIPVGALDRAMPVQTLGIEQLEHLGRTTPAERGAEGIVEFLNNRADDILERFTASPTCGLAGGSVNLWKNFDDAAERSMMTYSALVFRPETLPPDWHMGWARPHRVTGRKFS
jgi:hypothetical protein